MIAKAMLIPWMISLAYFVQETENRQRAEKRLQLQAMSQQYGQVLRWRVVLIVEDEGQNR